jgi:hypothetical protein
MSLVSSTVASRIPYLKGMFLNIPEKPKVSANRRKIASLVHRPVEKKKRENGDTQGKEEERDTLGKNL